jgi:hypothetical protein
MRTELVRHLRQRGVQTRRLRQQAQLDDGSRYGSYWIAATSNVDVADECGICGGDNSKCEEITGNYNISMTGYKTVLRIPKGSSNIDIRQNANNDTKYLVLEDGETGEYVLNSKTMIAPQQKDVIFGGVIISYSGSSAAVERITIPKNHRLTKDLVLCVLSVGDASSPDITYRYIINKASAPR